MIYVPTIPGTGTHFVRDELLAQADGKPPADNLFVEHIWPDTGTMRKWRHRLADRHQWPVIVPIRHPQAVAETWKRRGRPVYQLPDFWSRLVSEIDPFDPLYLPLDSPRRQEFLDAINLALAFDLKTDWPIVRGYPDAVPVTLNNREQATVETTIHQLPHFFGRFYRV